VLEGHLVAVAASAAVFAAVDSTESGSWDVLWLPMTSPVTCVTALAELMSIS